VGENLVGKTVGCFSYGSGCASSLYRLQVKSLPQLNHIIGALRDDKRVHQKTPEQFMAIQQEFSDTKGKFPYAPRYTQDRENGVYYLTSISEEGKRQYQLHHQ
jgi:3-hydroxy-3-methylglutaryl CoA synthase